MRAKCRSSWRSENVFDGLGYCDGGGRALFGDKWVKGQVVEAKGRQVLVQYEDGDEG